MELKATAFTKNVTTNGSSTPDWTQDIGQSKFYYMDYEGFNDICVGLLYYRVKDFDQITAPLGKGGRRQSLANMDNYSLEIAAIFDNIYVNGIHLDGQKFIMFVIREERETHRNRRQLKFSKDAHYRQENLNEKCIWAINKALNCSEDGSWIIVDMSINREADSHPRLDFTAVVVNPDGSRDFTSVEERNKFISKRRPHHTDASNFVVEKPKFEAPTALQQIYFGAPGTSKSTTIKNKVGDACQHRITFHPDTDYSNFVGCYKPTKEDGNEEITYKFVEQVFVKAYVDAWTKLIDNADERKEVFLIIEEINRGNCAQIFGDLFQLLDRDDDGYSDYTIEPDSDLQRHLIERFSGLNLPEEIKSGRVMQLPPNLFIWATMNTSDQSLFPIDSAFKRRWEWKYLPIKNEMKGHVIRVDARHSYDWWQFLVAVNDRIERLTELEDKQLGYWFAKPNEGVEISCDRFVSKVVFYLWNDVFKDYGNDGGSPFVIKQGDDKREKLKFTSFFAPDGSALPEVVVKFIESMGVTNLELKEPAIEPTATAEVQTATAGETAQPYAEHAPVAPEVAGEPEADIDDDDDDDLNDGEDKDLFNDIYK